MTSNENTKHIQVIKFSDLICGWLNELTAWKQALGCIVNNQPSGSTKDEELEHITDRFGQNTHPPTFKQIQDGRTIGTAVQANCYICHKYLKKDGKTKYQNTIWHC